MNKNVVGVALRDLKSGEVCVFGKDIGYEGGFMGEEKVDASRGLFEIRVVDMDTDKVVHSEEVVAEGEQDALFESNIKEALKTLKLKKEDVHIIVREFGGVPKKSRPKTVRFIGQLGKTVLGRETED